MEVPLRAGLESRTEPDDGVLTITAHTGMRWGELGPPKTPSSARTVHLPPFLADEPVAHRERNWESRFVFPSARDALRRRSNSRRRARLPAKAGNPKLGGGR
ncbi:hypothetical protein AB0M48_12450 [Lentzea sp. NPDC051208]|uniref:hypothetical protein n=1 Tax=Lentzea sp. NPDC051208 TaxID=3154642 RepID=UPI003418F8EE